MVERDKHKGEKCFPQYKKLHSERTNIQGLKRKEEKAGTDSFTEKSFTTRSQVLLQHALKSAATINTWAWQTLSSLTLSGNQMFSGLGHMDVCVCVVILRNKRKYLPFCAKREKPAERIKP